jgi:hypothetical protein
MGLASLDRYAILLTPQSVALRAQSHGACLFGSLCDPFDPTIRCPADFSHMGLASLDRYAILLTPHFVASMLSIQEVKPLLRS